MSFKNNLSTEKLIRIKNERLRSKSQFELKRAKEYNISFTPDQRALRIKKLKATKKTKDDEIKRREFRSKNQKEKKNKRFSNINESLEIKQNSLEKYKIRSSRRFSTEIADRIVLLTNRLKLLL
jgi:hypothetical protein